MTHGPFGMHGCQGRNRKRQIRCTLLVHIHYNLGCLHFGQMKIGGRKVGLGGETREGQIRHDRVALVLLLHHHHCLFACGGSFRDGKANPLDGLLTRRDFGGSHRWVLG